MHVLVATSSRHGSTHEIGQEIAATLNAAGFEATSADLASNPDPEPYDALIIGSAVYMGAWMDAAKRYVHDHAPELQTRPVWLFSSGPLGSETLAPAVQPDSIMHIGSNIGARDHQVFAGKLDPDSLGFKEKVILKVVKPPSGDFRPWDDIVAWAEGIATTLNSQQ